MDGGEKGGGRNKTETIIRILGEKGRAIHKRHGNAEERCAVNSNFSKIFLDLKKELAF